MDKIEVLLKEYEILHQESHNNINNRNKIISFGLATIGLIFASMFSADAATRTPILVLIVFCFVIPVISIFVLYLWLGEVERMVRAGDYLRELEDRINSILDKEKTTLRWEKWIISKERQIKYLYLVVILFFLFLACASPLIGIVLGQLKFMKFGWAVFIPWVSEALIIWHVWSKAKTFT